MPESVTLFLTHGCNLRCRMCGQWGEAGVTRKQTGDLATGSLDLAQAKAFIDSMAPFKPAITLFGGEPLLFKGCVELIAYIKSKGMHCLMITNGSMLSQHASRLVNAGLDELNISLDGSAGLHDQIRGMPGLFERIITGIDDVNLCKEAAGSSKPLINLQCTITRENYRQLHEMVDVAARAKAASLTFHNLIFLDHEAISRQKAFDARLGCSSADWEGFVFEPGIDVQALEQEKQRILGVKHGFSVDFYPNFSAAELKAYYNDPAYCPPEENCRCLSPWLVAYIFPDGSVRPCLNFSYSFGSLLEQPFARVWNSSRAVAWRRQLKEHKLFPACIRCTELYRY